MEEVGRVVRYITTIEAVHTVLTLFERGRLCNDTAPLP